MCFTGQEFNCLEKQICMATLAVWLAQRERMSVASYNIKQCNGFQLVFYIQIQLGFPSHGHWISLVNHVEFDCSLE